MTDHELKAKFSVKAAAALGRPAPGGLVAAPAISLLEHVLAVAEAIRGLGQQPCQDAAHLRALEILTALQVVADAQAARYAAASAAARADYAAAKQRAAERAEEGAKHQGEPAGIPKPWEPDEATATMIEADEIERTQAQAKMHEDLDVLKTVPLGTEDDS